MSRPIEQVGWRLVCEKTGFTACEGDERLDFRGDRQVVTGGSPPHKQGSTGRVWTRSGGVFFPSVVGLRWVEVDE